MDATCVPADIRNPTDLNLLNETREKTESNIDILYEPLKGVIDKPRTYRSRENIRYCHEHGIRISKPKLGRPLKEPVKDFNVDFSKGAC